jgi:hypothetical protein
LAEPIPLTDGLAASIVASVSPRGYPLAAPLVVDGIVQVRNRALLPEAPAAVESISCPEAGNCLLLPADGDADLHYPFLVAMVLPVRPGSRGGVQHRRPRPWDR